MAALVAVAVAAPQYQKQNQNVVVVKELLHDNIGLENYKYSYQLSDGQEKEENGEIHNFGTENESLHVKGSFTWVDPETNQQYNVNYVADENGFQPQGAHIPSK